jgi:hypothetical protein
MRIAMTKEAYTSNRKNITLDKQANPWIQEEID